MAGRGVLLCAGVVAVGGGGGGGGSSVPDCAVSVTGGSGGSTALHDWHWITDSGLTVGQWRTVVRHPPPTAQLQH